MNELEQAIWAAAFVAALQLYDVNEEAAAAYAHKAVAAFRRTLVKK